MEDPTLQQMAVSEGIEVCGDSMLEQVYPEGWQPVGRTTAEQGKSVGKKDGATERSCYGVGVSLSSFLTIHHYFNWP